MATAEQVLTDNTCKPSRLLQRLYSNRGSKTLSSQSALKSRAACRLARVEVGHIRSCQRIRFDSFTDWARALCMQRGHLASLLKLSLQNRAMVGSVMFSRLPSARLQTKPRGSSSVECAAEIHQCRGGLAELPVWNQSCCKCANQTHHMSKGRDGSHSCSRCGFQSVQDGV